MGRTTDTKNIICKFIGQYYMSHGYGPSIREIAIAVNLRSTSTVHAHVERLKKAGMLTTSEEKPQPRTIVPTEKLYELIHMEHDEIPAVAQKSYVQGAALINPYLDPMIFANSLRALREALHLSREQVEQSIICAPPAPMISSMPFSFTSAIPLSISASSREAPANSNSVPPEVATDVFTSL